MDSKEFFYEFGIHFYQIDGFYDEFAKKSGVKPNLLWILYAINDGKHHSQREICTQWLLPCSTVNTLTKELESQGYVELKQIKGKKRELEIVLTESGKEYADSILKKLYDIESNVYKRLELKAQDILNDLKLLSDELKNVRDNK